MPVALFLRGRRLELSIPTLQALVLADHVYQDVMTGKKVIAGTFNRLYVSEFGTNVNFGTITYAFICVTNVEEVVPLELRYVDLSDNSVLLRAAGIEVASKDRFLSNELIVQVPPFPLPHAGVYAFEVHANDKLIGSLRIKVEKLPEKGTDE